MKLWIVQVRRTGVTWAIATSEALAKEYIAGAGYPEELRWFVTYQTKPGLWQP